MLKRKPAKIYMAELFDLEGQTPDEMLISRTFFTSKADAKQHLNKLIKKHPFLNLEGNIRVCYPKTLGYDYGLYCLGYHIGR